MKKKVLVLGMVSCVAGIVTATASGCSSSETTSSTTTPDASQDVKSERTPVEAGGDEDAGTCEKKVAVTDADIEKDLGTYKGGVITPDKCSPQDLTQFEANLKDANIKEWADLGKDLSADCSACVITKNTADNWGPIVVFDDGGGFVNFGSCFGAVENSDECGKQVQYGEFCYDAICGDCTTDAEQNSCVQSSSAAGGSCESYASGVETNCKNFNTTYKKCTNAAAMAKTLCGAASSDAGTDGDAADQ